MTKKTFAELDKLFENEDLKIKYLELFALSFFIKRALKSHDYKPSKDLNNFIDLTPVGAEWASALIETGIPISEIYLAIFSVFGWHDLFINIQKTNTKFIQEFVDKEILKNNFIYPWNFDHCLYDKYFETFPKTLNELSWEETSELLKDTPKGVYQIGKYIIGPFGLIESTYSRFIYPPLKFGLYHCSDPSCPSVHEVKLSNGKNNIYEVSKEIVQKSSAHLGGPSPWLNLFVDQLDQNYYDVNNSTTFPYLLFDAFSENELKTLLQKIIEIYPNIRKKFPKNKTYQSFFKGSAGDIVKKLNNDHCCQLILIESDEVVIECLEMLIDLNEIVIPSTEIRTPKKSIKGRSMFDYHWECSKFGVRSVSNEFDLPIIKLKDLIWQIYENLLDELIWLLKLEKSEDLGNALEVYIYNENPEIIIQKLIFNKRENLEKTFTILKFGHYVYKPSSEDFLIYKILWKLGFNINVFPDYQTLFWEREKAFLSVTENCENTETENDKIRSEGVNYFVSLEEILDYSLSFITWTLLEDHFLNTKELFNFDEAREYMAMELNSVKTNDDVVFDPKKNTLYPLIQGFKILAIKCDTIIKNKNDYIRPDNEFPGYYGKINLVKFPYLSKKAILDIKTDEVIEIMKLLHEITETLTRSNIISTRNKIGHKSSKFPSKKEIIESVSMVSELIENMEKFGIVPSVYLSHEFITDKFDRKKLILKNYNDTSITIHLPYESNMKSEFRYKPIIIVPSLQLKFSNECINFDLIETSDFIEMWKDYPKKIFK